MTNLFQVDERYTAPLLICLMIVSEGYFSIELGRLAVAGGGDPVSMIIHVVFVVLIAVILFLSIRHGSYFIRVRPQEQLIEISPHLLAPTAVVSLQDVNACFENGRGESVSEPERASYLRLGGLEVDDVRVSRYAHNYQKLKALLLDR